MRISTGWLIALVLGCFSAWQTAGGAENEPINQQIERLKDKVFRNRILAAQQLGDWGPQAAAAKDALITALRVRDYNGAKDHLALVTALLKIGVDPQPLIVEGVLKGDHLLPPNLVNELRIIEPQRLHPCISPLVGALRNEKRDVRCRAAETLRIMNQYGVDATPDLLRALDDPEPLVRDRAATAIGGILCWLYQTDIHPATKPAVEALIKSLQDDTYYVRFQAAVALGWIGPPAKAAIHALQKLEQDPDQGVALQAKTALEKIGPMVNQSPEELFRDFKSPDAGVQGKAFAAARRLGPDASPVVSYLLGVIKNGDSADRLQAIRGLGVIGKLAKLAVPELIKALKSPEPNIRNGAAFALGGIGPNASAAIPALGAALKDTGESVGDAAMFGLAQIGEGSLPILIAALGDPDPKVRARSAYALGAFGPLQPVPERIAPALKRALQDPDKTVRIKAAISLGSNDPTASEAIPLLAEALKESDRRIWWPAAMALANLGPAAIPTLTKAAEECGDQKRAMIGSMLKLANPGTD